MGLELMRAFQAEDEEEDLSSFNSPFQSWPDKIFSMQKPYLA